MKVRLSNESLVSVDTKDSDGIAALYFDPCLKYASTAARVFVTLKNDEDTTYVYYVEDKAALLFEALTAENARLFLIWATIAASNVRKMVRAEDGEWAVV
jgi:hypothetical protein